MYFKQESAVPFNDETHGADDVPVFARGPMSHVINGVREQNYLAHFMQYAACVGNFKNDCDRKVYKPEQCVGGGVSNIASKYLVILIFVSVSINKIFNV